MFRVGETLSRLWTFLRRASHFYHPGLRPWYVEGMLGKGAHANNNLQPMATYEPMTHLKETTSTFWTFCTVHTYNEGYAYVPVEHGRTKCILQLSAVHLLDNWLGRRLIFLALVLKTSAFLLGAF